MRDAPIARGATLCLLALLGSLSPKMLGAGEGPNPGQVSGCICSLDPAARRLDVARWNADNKSYEVKEPLRLAYDDLTRIGVPGTILTVSDFGRGKSLLLPKPGTGKTEEIAGMADLALRKAHLRWEMTQTQRLLREIILVPWFVDETVGAVKDPDSPTGFAWSVKCSCK